ncbi:TAR DNA-binding protein 43 [Clonorchis sinensis]|uniref:TAR DNA-binding protein 43 n=1 Tax=Clonorchis sinensis TaxID=79923 RepID=G7YBZ2_CLOSI|nr:TAR DNA-binding protein 43 [Clonorchis sinensis]
MRQRVWAWSLEECVTVGVLQWVPGHIVKMNHPGWILDNSRLYSSEMNHVVYARICEEEGTEPVELPVEADGTLLLPTLTAQFPKCTGLKYKSEDSGCFRGLRLVGDHIYPPVETDWDNVFYCVFPKDKKRKGDEDTEDTKQKVKCLEGRKCTDLIVLNLAWQTDETKLRNYFSQFGDLVMVQIKKDPDTGKSRGYGFVRFSDYSGQAMCLAERHMIDGRLCDVRIPLSKQEGDRQEVSRKIHVGNLPESIGADALRQHFLQYGLVIDVFIPKPFRSFAFVTFDDPDVAASLLGKDLTIQGHKVTIGSAVPKLPSHVRQNPSFENAGGNLRSPYPGSPMAHGPLWNSPWSPALGVFPGGGAYGGSPNGGLRNSMGLNPAAAAAAATLAAQYTRAHQRQSSGGNMNGGYPDAKPSPDANTNAALAALNILNNPNVVAAIVSAAAGVTKGQSSFTNSGAKVDYISAPGTTKLARKTALSSANEGSSCAKHDLTNSASGEGHNLQRKFPLR